MQEYVICEKEDLVAMADAVREATGDVETYSVPELRDALINSYKNLSGGSMSEAQIIEIVEKYLNDNPIEAGATKEEAAQIQQNKADIEQLAQDKLDADKLPEAINEALAQAKVSGEFKGEPGKTPEKGKDYFTDAEKQEIAEQAAEMVEIPEGGTVTPEQIASAVEDYMAEHPVSGLNNTEKSLMLSLFRKAVYTDNMSATIAQLESLWNGGEVPDIPDVPDEPDEPVVTKYTITNELVNVKSSNSTSSVNEGANYTATLTADDGYEISNVTVYMGGVDVTASVYANGLITISSVTGNVEIIASAVVVEEKPAELITDGMLAYFDFRTAEYNNTATGGATTIASTQGSGQLFAWAHNGVAVQDERGIHFANARVNMYSQAGNTSQTVIGEPMTCIVLTYGQVATMGYNSANTGAKWSFCPEYNKSSGGTATVPAKNGAEYNNDDCTDYNFCVYRVDGNTLTEIMDTSVATFDGDSIDGFASWVTSVSVQVETATVDGKYCTAAAIYNRALSDVEIEEMRAFMKTLEVTA